LLKLIYNKHSWRWWWQWCLWWYLTYASQAWYH